MPTELDNLLSQLKDEKTAKDAAAAVDKAQMRAVWFDNSAARAFFTQLAVNLEVRPDWSIPTANVDGKTIRYNPGFIASLNDDGVHFVMIGHEPAHCHLLHAGRGMGMECNECRQMAADGEVNEMCQQAGFAVLPGALLPGKAELHDCRPGQTFEEMYSILHAKHQQQGGQQGGQQGKQPNGQPMPGAGDSDGDSDGDKPSQDPGKCGSFSPAKDEAQARQIETEWRGKIAAAAQEVGRRMAEGKLKGDLPGSMQRWIDAVLNPKPHWRETLREFLTQSLRKRGENDWARQNRRGLAAGIYLPSHKGDVLGEIVVAIDTSGSVSDDLLLQFANELQGVIDCEPSKAQIVYCDASVNHVDTWEPSDGPIVFRAVGRGGTDFRPVWRHIRDNELEPACCIYLTDGEGTYGDEPPYPVLWALSQEYDVPWGRKVLVAT